ncbi:hypothetical protein BCA37_10675 [Mycobacterium sp. djl-10]|nr:hypothetical protein BCA37_10675 [Mycobacterium sp. djl-10]
MTTPGNPRWKVSKRKGRWTVTSPTGATLEPFPSQRTAFNLAMSMAAIGQLLQRVQQTQHPLANHPALRTSPKHVPGRRTPLQVIQ